MEFNVIDSKGFLSHCEVAALIIANLPINPHTKHHIRGAIREASLKVTNNKGRGTTASYISVSARETIDGLATPDGLVLEHVVPVSLINEKVLSLEKPTKFQVAEVVYEWTVLATVTREQHQLLRARGLNDRMPSGWDGVDKFARYKTCSIQLVECAKTPEGSDGYRTDATE